MRHVRNGLKAEKWQYGSNTRFRAPSLGTEEERHGGRGGATRNQGTARKRGSRATSSRRQPGHYEPDSSGECRATHPRETHGEWGPGCGPGAGRMLCRARNQWCVKPRSGRMNRTALERAPVRRTGWKSAICCATRAEPQDLRNEQALIPPTASDVKSLRRQRSETPAERPV